MQLRTQVVNMFSLPTRGKIDIECLSQGPLNIRNGPRNSSPNFNQEVQKNFRDIKALPNLSDLKLKLPQTTPSKVRKPSALTVDHETYTAICSRKRTQPTLVTSP